MSGDEVGTSRILDLWMVNPGFALGRSRSRFLCQGVPTTLARINKNMIDKETEEQSKPAEGTTEQVHSKVPLGDAAEHAETSQSRKREWAVVLCLLLTAALVLIGILVSRETRVDSPPGNDRCEHAFELPTNGTVVRGTFRGATPDPGGDYCGGSGDPENNPVVWYKFWGTGTALHITGPSIAVYYGDCDDLREEMTNEDFGDENNELYDGCAHGSYTFDSEAGRLYYIYVATCPCDHCMDDFDVSVTEIQT